MEEGSIEGPRRDMSAGEEGVEEDAAVGSGTKRVCFGFGTARGL